MRCLNLAEELRTRGAEIKFICREYKGNQFDSLKKRKIPLIILPKPEKSILKNGNNYADFFGVTQQEDALQTIKALGGDTVSWMVVDNYAIDIEWERSIRPYIEKLMVIDDLANRQHDCDILLDQNYSNNTQDRYSNLLPKQCKMLLGPHYALVRPEFIEAKKKNTPIDTDVKRILVFFGGVDPNNITGMTLEALSDPVFKDMEVDIVIAETNYNHKEIEIQIANRSNTKLHGLQPHLANLMENADLAVGAGGSTTWERLCMGLPTVVVCLAENQKPGIMALAQDKLIYYVGEFDKVNANNIRDTLVQCIENPHSLSELSIRSRLLVDGYGVMRVSELLSPALGVKLHLRKAKIDDVNLYFQWVGDSQVRKNSMNSRCIPWAQHKAWFIDKIESSASHLFVLMADHLPIGQIRFDIHANKATIDYSLDILVRGRHLAIKLVLMGICALRDIQEYQLYAEVKKTNKASCSTFTRLGFDEQLIIKSKVRIFRINSSKFINDCSNVSNNL